MQAATVGAATCSASDVQGAVNKAAAGDTVTIPAGTCTWTTAVNWTAPANVTLIGAGSQSVTGGGDVTVIVDGISRGSGSDVAALAITTNAAGKFRLSGVTFRGSGNSATYTDNGTVRIGGTSTQVRVDHVHFDNIRRQAMSTGGVYGVMDHTVFDMAAGGLDNAFRPEGVFATFGDPEWATSTSFGSSQFFYVEDSVFNNGVINDCIDGGRQVFRHNTFTNTWAQTHPTGSQGRRRGCRAMEIYQNTFNGGACSPTCFNTYYMSSGTALIWGNNAGSSYQNLVSLHSMRRNNGTYSQSATPAGWGYCGTSFNGGGSKWDGNNDASSGYPCLDQPGRGQGQRLVNDFPSIVNQATSSIAWPNQALEPVYLWNNTWTGSGGGTYVTIYDSPSLTNNVDVYYQCGAMNPSCSSFTGAAGIGSGALSARPANCSTSVGYWATDTSTLYRCSSGSWVSFYTPYTYPHPLISGQTQLTAPTPPTNLRIVVGN
jgi:hypothetical protein